VSGHILGPIAVIAWVIAFVWGYVGIDPKMAQCEYSNVSFIHKVRNGLVLQTIKPEQILDFRDAGKSFEEPHVEGRYLVVSILTLLGYGLGKAIHYAMVAPVCPISPLYPELPFPRN
jgi:hypothetical protein